MSPTDAIVLSRKKIAGLALTEGGLSSHVVILARNYGLPTIVGVNRSSLQKKITNGELIVIDGEIGEILADPDEATLNEYNEKINSEKAQQALLDKYLNLPAETKDPSNRQQTCAQRSHQWDRPVQLTGLGQAGV